ncbi:MAG: DUF3618 domain-containing protein [Devosia sp.]
MPNETKSAADLEREVAEQRDRLEARIVEIKDKLSPGQLLDEALSYTKHGGAHLASNLGSQISANPLPVALVGIGLAWLISSTAGANHQQADVTVDLTGEDNYYPYARLNGGGLKRVSHAADEAGEWWSEFESSSGDRYTARSSEYGERAGHFTDSAGKNFSGFIDEAGNRVRDFQDEAGNALAQARSWADHNWRDLRNNVSGGVSGIGGTVRDAFGNVTAGTRFVGGSMQQQSEQLTRQVIGLFDQQPLIGGALAFAIGAAVGAALPHTAQEDEMLGAQADKLRSKAVKQAGKIYEKGKEKASELYEEATDQAGTIYSDVKDKVADIGNGASGQSSISRH